VLLWTGEDVDDGRRGEGSRRWPVVRGGGERRRRDGEERLRVRDGTRGWTFKLEQMSILYEDMKKGEGKEGKEA